MCMKCIACLGLTIVTLVLVTDGLDLRVAGWMCVREGGRVGVAGEGREGARWARESKGRRIRRGDP